MIIFDFYRSTKSFISKLIKFILPMSLKKFIKNKIYPYYFYPTPYRELPKNNYVNKNNLHSQIDLINKFNISKKQNSFMTCKDLIKILRDQYKENDSFNFLDYGGENIDFYLDLKKNFKNINYFFFNLDSINHIFKKIKKKFNYKNLHIIDNTEKILSKNFDFINFGSSIQYVNNYIYILEKLTNNSKYIFFSGITLYNSNSIKFHKHMVVKQTNCTPFNHLYFFNKIYFKNIFLNKNYNLIFERSNTSDMIDYNNFKKKFINIQYLDILFIKKK